MHGLTVPVLRPSGVPAGAGILVPRNVGRAMPSLEIAPSVGVSPVTPVTALRSRSPDRPPARWIPPVPGPGAHPSH